MTGLSTHIGKSWFLFFFFWVHASRLHILKHRRNCHTKNNTSTLLSLLWQLSWEVPEFSLTLGSLTGTLSLAMFSLNLNVYATADLYPNLWCRFFSVQLWLSLGLLQLNSCSVVFSSIPRGSCTQLCFLQCLLPAASAVEPLCVPSCSSLLLVCGFWGFVPPQVSLPPRLPGDAAVLPQLTHLAGPSPGSAILLSAILCSSLALPPGSAISECCWPHSVFSPCSLSAPAPLCCCCVSTQGQSLVLLLVCSAAPNAPSLPAQLLGSAGTHIIASTSFPHRLETLVSSVALLVKV